jgi:hypothetical protein
MTDKQTALLLRQIAGRIRSLAAEVEPLILSQETIDIVAITWQTQLGKQPEVIETRLAAVQRILDLAEDLADEAELLTPASQMPEIAAP